MQTNNANYRRDIKKLELVIKDKETYLSKLTDIIMHIKKYYDGVCQKLNIKDHYKILIPENGVPEWKHNFEILPRQRSVSQANKSAKNNNLDSELPENLMDKLNRLSVVLNTNENQQMIREQFKKDLEEHNKIKENFTTRKTFLKKLTEQNALLKKQLSQIENVR